MKIEVWSDFACPFCYIGEQKLEHALDELNLNRDDVEIDFKSFQLNPNASLQKGKDINQLIADKYHISYEQAKMSNEQIIQSAKEVGLEYQFDIITPNNTALAHQVAKFAKQNNKEKAMVDRLFKAYFQEGKDIGNRETLLDLAEEEGLNRDELEIALDKKKHLLEVISDQEAAQKMGVQGVPYFVINDQVIVSGAQSVEHFAAALSEAAL